MMARENNETMQRTCEASLNCLQTRALPYNLQFKATPSEDQEELKDETGRYRVGDVVEQDPQVGSEFHEPLNEFTHPTGYQRHFGAWSSGHFYSQKVQHCQVNAFERQFHPYPVEHQFQYVPFHMFAQGSPHGFQHQEFQYFVVIDFEATCDKDKNPHPQEIIEFPSVIVSSVTGQLEACFQTYVRPTCNQLLSDFCKDLTGIQQIQLHC